MKVSLSALAPNGPELCSPAFYAGGRSAGVGKPAQECRPSLQPNQDATNSSPPSQPLVPMLFRGSSELLGGKFDCTDRHHRPLRRETHEVCAPGSRPKSFCPDNAPEHSRIPLELSLKIVRALLRVDTHFGYSIELTVADANRDLRVAYDVGKSVRRTAPCRGENDGVV